MNHNASTAQYGGHTTPPPNLPHTGADVGTMLSLATLLVLGGLAIKRGLRAH